MICLCSSRYLGELPVWDYLKPNSRLEIAWSAHGLLAGLRFWFHTRDVLVLLVSPPLASGALRSPGWVWGGPPAGLPVHVPGFVFCPHCLTKLSIRGFNVIDSLKPSGQKWLSCFFSPSFLIWKFLTVFGILKKMF